MKKILKIIIVVFIIVSMFIVWKKRVYIQHRLPVVIELIQQQYKWNRNNTGTYVYKYISNINSFGGAKLSHFLLFIKDKKVQKAIHIGNGYSLEYLGDRKAIESIYLTERESHRDSYYLIDTRFNEIWSSFWVNNFSFDVEYDEKYGYAKILHWVEIDPVEYQKNIGFDHDNILDKYSLELKMFKVDTEFNEEFLTKVLQDYREDASIRIRQQKN
jgi:uncharacterized protein YxeA